MFQEKLISQDKDVNVIYMNFESFEYDEITNYKLMYNEIKTKIDKNKKAYILLDEVQRVDSWEKAVNALLVDFNVDIYITGSNAYLLSSELSTYLSGRYVEIKILPLSFKEYLQLNQFDPSMTIDEKFKLYIKYGAMPGIYQFSNNESLINNFLIGIYNTVVMKDVIQRNDIKDVLLLEDIVKYIISNIGSIVSSKKIANYLTSQGRKTTSDTIMNYLKMLENAFIIYKVKRYDIKGKQVLRTLEKYYVVDIGIRNAIIGYRDSDYGYVLENIIYFELLRREYDVCIGKQNDLEIDFIATNPNDKKYYQVTLTMNNEEVAKRELKSLQTVKDSYEKTILTLDRTFINSYNGIKVKNIIDFLLE